MRTSTEGTGVACRAPAVVGGREASFRQSAVHPSLETLAPRRGFCVAASCTHAPSAMPCGSGDQRERRSWQRAAWSGSATERGGSGPTIGSSFLVEISSDLSTHDRAWLCTAAYLTSDDIPVVLILRGITVAEINAHLNRPVQMFGCVKFGVRFATAVDDSWHGLVMPEQLVIVSSASGERAVLGARGAPIRFERLHAAMKRCGSVEPASLRTLWSIVDPELPPD